MKHLGIWTAIAVGGALGALFRFYVSAAIQERVESVFPWATWVVNLLGCLLVGLFFTLGMENAVLSPATRALIITGFLGAFTTFSTFSNEIYLLFREGAVGLGLLYMISSNVLGVIFVAVGTWVAHWIIR